MDEGGSASDKIIGRRWRCWRWCIDITDQTSAFIDNVGEGECRPRVMVGLNTSPVRLARCGTRLLPNLTQYRNGTSRSCFSFRKSAGSMGDRVPGNFLTDRVVHSTPRRLLRGLVYRLRSSTHKGQKEQHFSSLGNTGGYGLAIARRKLIPAF